MAACVAPVALVKLSCAGVEDAVAPRGSNGPPTPTTMKAQATERRRYSKQSMHDILNTMSLSTLTATHAWKEDCLAAWPVDTGRTCVPTTAEVVQNMHMLQQLLQEPVPFVVPECAAHSQTFSQHRLKFDIPSHVISPLWSPAQQAAAYAACAAYASQTAAIAGRAALAASAHLRPIKASGALIQTCGTSARPNPFSAHSSLARKAHHGEPDTSEPSWRSRDCSHDNRHTHSSGRATSVPGAISRAHSLPSLTPGSVLWTDSIKKLLGLQDGSNSDHSTFWLVQSPNITGAMGPISAGDMAAWLLQGLTPKQLSRPVHKPLLEATAADPVALMVCGLMAGELERGLRPGKNAFKPLKDLLPGLASGLDYSTATKGLMDNRLPGPPSAQHRAPQPTASGCSSLSCADIDTLASTDEQIPLPDTPTASVSTPASSYNGDYKQARTPKSCAVLELVAQLQHTPAFDLGGLRWTAKEIRDRARSSPVDRELLVRADAVPELMRLMQLPIDSADGQPHTAAAWALYYLMGRSKAATQGCAVAQSAMAAADAVKHATSLLKAAWKQGGSSGTYSEPLIVSKLMRSSSPSSSACTSASTSPVSSKPQDVPEGVQKVAAKLQEAAVAVLAGIATTPSGKQTILKEGAIPSIVCMLGSRYPRVVSAAVSTVRNLSSPQDYAVSRALFAAGASTMLVHVVASNTEPACKQTALRVLLDLASAALSTPMAPSTDDDPATAQAQVEEYTADNAWDRLVKRGLPIVLLKLLHQDPPLALQARAIEVLRLLAVQKPQEVLGSIKNLVEYAFLKGQEKQQITGVQVLQQLMRSSSNTVKGGAVELLQALADAGLVGRGRSCADLEHSRC